jgi:DNA-binding NtrC family response regulator
MTTIPESYLDFVNSLHRQGGRSPQIIDNFMRVVYQAELARNKGNKSKAAKAVGVSRMTFYRRLSGWGICH